MTPEPLSIGVLITYYGERELLRECLDSLASQTRLPHEILIYDDASDAPAQDYVPVGLAVRVLRGNENRGPAFGRNQLLRASTSAYIHFHDADDLFYPDWHARVREVLEAGDVDVVFTEIAVHDGLGIRSTHVLALSSLAEAGNDLVRFCIRGIMLVPSGTYRRDTVLAIGGYRTALWQSEDFDFHVRLAASDPRFAVITDPLVTIRVRPDGRSSDRVQTLTSYVQAVAALSEELPPSYRSDLADAAARAGSTLFKLGARAEATTAFQLSAQLGPPRFSTQRPLYRALVNAVGFERTEQLAQAYRSILPARMRAYLGHAGGK
ncbi:MAG: glycosyltransferase [Chloroflexota bacterium]|nr:glycosyltransferase [Chloroflexota bacterium]